MTVDSIGCDVGEAVEFEAKVMVQGLKQIREAIGATNSKIEDVCLQSPEYSYVPILQFSCAVLHHFTGAERRIVGQDANESQRVSYSLQVQFGA